MQKNSQKRVRIFGSKNVWLLVLAVIVVWLLFAFLKPLFSGFAISFEEFVFSVVGGLGMLLFGMNLMSQGLQKIAGRRLKIILQTLTKNRFLGVLLGCLATMVVQSSSTVTVMTVGFVNAGLMGLKQAIAIVLGSNIGTTVTAQLIAFQIDKYALPVIGIGTAFYLFSKRDRGKFFGETLFGFGILFFGLYLMKEAFLPLSEDEALKSFFIKLEDSVWLGVLAGAVLTMVMQASAAIIGLVMSLAAAGLITLETAVLIVLGSNIGTTITANLAAIGGSVNARRAARAHFVFNIIGVLLVMLFLPWFLKLVAWSTAYSGDILRQIANAHTFFNVIAVLLFLPFVSWLARVSKWLVKDKKEELSYLEEGALEDVSVALDQVHLALAEMAGLVIESLGRGRDCLVRKSSDWDKVYQLEDKSDYYQNRIIDYLEKITHKDLPQEESKRVPTLVYVTNDLEKIGDLSRKLGDIDLELREEGAGFSVAEERELKKYFTEVLKLLRKLKNLLRTRNAGVIRGLLRDCEALRVLYENLKKANKKRYRKKANIAVANHYFDVIGVLDEVVLRVKNVGGIVGK